MIDHQIPSKANSVLNIILIGLLLILVRVWYLSVIQHDEHVLQANKPQRRTVIEHVERATIRDRFNIPLALNQTQYRASVCYAQIRQVPSVVWKEDGQGKRIRVQARLDYISDLAKLLAKELQMDPVSIEDTIHGKAALFPHTPFVIKENISEKQYYRLKMLERQWMGIQAERAARRTYPLGRTGADIIGYMGAISQKEYAQIAQEMQELRTYLSKREGGETAYLPLGFHNPLEVRKRLNELEEKAYTIQDFIGKSGVEETFDEDLRGFYGKHVYEVDIKGNFLRKLPGSREAMGGRRVLLSISAELQEFAEALLSQNETPPKNESPSLQAPWIKGGAIVVMEPRTGEVLTLASYPRFNPNDFVPAMGPEQKMKQQSSLLRWIENETYIKEIWDGKRPLEKECYSFARGAFYEESLTLSWEHYLEGILPAKSSTLAAMRKIVDLKTALYLQNSMDALLKISEEQDIRVLLQALYPNAPHVPFKVSVPSEKKKQIQEKLAAHSENAASLRVFIDSLIGQVAHNDDKLLVLDLCRMMAKQEEFSEELVQSVGDQTLSDFRELCQTASLLNATVRAQMQELHHDIDFTEWRKVHFKEFLADKRKEEKAKKRYTRPYTEYLDQMERRMFNLFWEDNRWAFLQTFILGTSFSDKPELAPYIAHLIQLHKEKKENLVPLKTLSEALSSLTPSLALSYLKSMRTFEDLNRPLLGKYTTLRSVHGQQLEKHLASAFYPISGYSYGRSQAYRQSAPQGSVFKLITSYQALLERYREAGPGNLNPLTLIDDLQGSRQMNSDTQVLGRHLNGQTLLRSYKGGRLPRSSHHVGKIDLLGALEQSSNLYFAVLSGDCISDPTHLAEAARQFGYGQRSGIELPGETSGAVPSDLSHNKTGLYSFSIGQHAFAVSPLQTASMICAIANKGELLQPKVIKLIAGKEPSHAEEKLFSSPEFPYQHSLSLAGIHFPLFTEAQRNLQKTSICYVPTVSKRSIPMPDEVRNILLKGMESVIKGPRGTARASIIRGIDEHPQSLKDYVELQDQLLAKTGTSELLFKKTIDAETRPVKENHNWFAAISFTSPPIIINGQKEWGEPELAIVVYIRFGKAGRDGAAIAAQIVKKWREICAKHAIKEE